MTLVSSVSDTAWMRLTLVVSDRSLPDTPCIPRLDTDLWGLGLLYTLSCSTPWPTLRCYHQPIRGQDHWS